MKKGYEIILFALLAMSVILLIPKANITGYAVYSFPAGNNCSNESIKSIWDSVFYESSTGINIINNLSYNYSTSSGSKCLSYAAYKIKNNEELYLMFGSYEHSITQSDFLFAIKANVTSDYLQRIQSITASNLVIGDLRDSQGSVLSIGEIYTSIPSQFLKQDNTQTIASAKSRAESTFKMNPVSEWTINISTGERIWASYIRNSSNMVNWNMVSTSANYTQRELRIAENPLAGVPSQGCVPLWTAVSGPCLANDTYVVWYNDTNKCAGADGRPANESRSCFYSEAGKRRVKGNPIQQNTYVNVYIDSVLLNSSKTFNSTRKIEIRDSALTRVEFYHNFSSDLDLSITTIKKQLPTDSYGYLIINGINISKTIRMDRLNSLSNSVCVKEASVTNIQEITTNCSDIDETLLPCPGIKFHLNCSATNSTFTINGATSTAVKEMTSTETSLASCSPYWNCSIWSNCTDSLKTRSCIDLNACNVTTDKPAETEACTTVCSPLWICTPWSPIECPKNKSQYRSCSDQNQCGTDDDKPVLSKACNGTASSVNSSGLVIIFLIVLAIAVIITLAIVLIKMRKPMKGSNIQVVAKTPESIDDILKKRQQEEQSRS